MANPGLFKTLSASGTIDPYRIVAWGTADLQAVQADAATDALMGTTDDIGSTSDGEVDVAMGDLPEVEYGADVVRGDPLTSDSQGRAIKATVSASRIIGFAHVSASVGVIGPYIFSPGILP